MGQKSISSTVTLKKMLHNCYCIQKCIELFEGSVYFRMCAIMLAIDVSQCYTLTRRFGKSYKHYTSTILPTHFIPESFYSENPTSGYWEGKAFPRYHT